MDNLELFSSNEFYIDNKCGYIKSCSNVDGTIFCFIFGRNSLCVQNVKQNNKQIFEIEIFETLKYIQHLPVNKSIFLASQKELGIFDFGTERAIILHSLQKEILDLVWNPTQSMFILVNADFELFLFAYSTSALETPSFTKIFNTKLMSKVPESILVGWGTQSTQFKGNKQNKKSAVIERGVTNIYDGPPKISWKANGEQFVINFFKNGCRHVKVFDNQLNALYESDIQNNLSDPVSFMGQGQYISSCVVDNNINKIIIFEKNCKVKASHELQETQGVIRKLLSHPELNVLGILSEDTSNSCIDIYLYSNACWFLKQQLHYRSSIKLHDFFWVDSPTYQVCKMVVFTNEKIEYHTFRIVTNTSVTKALTGVINGKFLNLYFFANTVIPPPMLSFSYEHHRPINIVRFHPHKSQCILVDSHLEMSFISIEKLPAKLVSSVKINSEQKSTFLKIESIEDKINEYFQSENHESFCEHLFEYNFNSIPTESFIVSKKKYETEYFTNNILDDSEVILYRTTHNLKMDDVTLSINIILNACKDLYINDNIICSGVTSALLFRKYLIWTTSAGMLYCIREKYFNKTFDTSNVFVRPIEQGGRILCSNNMTPPRIILQFPRGNLETVSCKLITIDILDEMLSKNNWKEALDIIRLEKINWNVLIDLNPQRFCNNIEHFVKAAKFSNLLTTIVTDFDLNENCFRTIYYNHFKNVDNNVNKKQIVEKIIDLLCSMDSVNNLNCIVVLQQKHISLKLALVSVKEIYAVNNAKFDSVCATAIKSLLQQSHLNDVINEAFTLFDLRLLALIYRNSNEDPKVYEPELTILHNMSELKRRFDLCLKANNLISAVKYLLLADEFEEKYIVDFLTKYKLENVAYRNISRYSNNRHSYQFKLVSTVFAKRLAIEGKYSEAGFILKRCKFFEESLHHYQKALEWREVIVLMNILKYKEEEKIPILETLASELISANNLDDATIIYEHHIKDYKKAVISLVEYHSFQRAINIAKMYDLDILNSTVIPCLLKYSHTLMEKVELFHSRFHMYENRLRIVRQERMKKYENLLRDEGFYKSQDIELFSDTSSVSSGHSSKKTSSSRNSTLSSRNRRKEDRKKIDLREGGFYEDIALMRALHIMYEEVYLFTQVVRDICLIEELNNDRFCRKLHKKLSELQIDMRKKLPEIWPEEFYKTVSTNQSELNVLIQNKNDLDPKYSVPPSEDLLTDSWKLHIFS